MVRMCVVVGLVGLLAACGSEAEKSEAKPVPQKIAESKEGQTAQPDPQPEAAPVERKLAIQGMTCGGCAASVRQALLSVDGVLEADVNFKKGEAVIKCDASVSGEALINQVENYEVGGVKQSYKAQEVADTKPAPTTGATSIPAQDDTSVERTLAIQGMCCSGCAAGVRSALMAVDGVREADVSFADGKAVVKCDASVASTTLIDTLQKGKRPYRVQEITQ